MFLYTAMQNLHMSGLTHLILGGDTSLPTE